MANERAKVSAPPAPSSYEDELDSEMTAMQAEMESGVVTDDEELDDGDDEEGADDTHADGVPDDEEEDDDFLSPLAQDEQEDDEEAEESQEPNADQKAKRPGRDSNEDGVTLSRKAKGKLIEELKSQLQAEQSSNQEKEQQLAALENARGQQLQEEKKLEEAVDQALGLDEEYEAAVDAGLRGDADSAQRAAIWKANRAFYGKLVKRSQSEVKTNFLTIYETVAGELAGVNKETMLGSRLAEGLKHLYEAGGKQTAEPLNKRIADLEQDLQTWKTRYKSLRTKSQLPERAPITGGETAPRKIRAGESSWERRLLDPITGLPTDEAEAAIREYGSERVLSGARRVK